MFLFLGPHVQHHWLFSLMHVCRIIKLFWFRSSSPLLLFLLFLLLLNLIDLYLEKIIGGEMFVYYNRNLLKILSFSLPTRTPSVDLPPESRSTHIIYRMLAVFTRELLLLLTWGLVQETPIFSHYENGSKLELTAIVNLMRCKTWFLSTLWSTWHFQVKFFYCKCLHLVE